MVRKDVLENGVRVVTEQISSVRSVSIGVWVDVGSRDERLGEEGVSHFIEHMVFKGTRRRSAEAISREIDALGGELNAFTSRECTTFYPLCWMSTLRRGSICGGHFPSLPIRFQELSKEKRVVEEIRMVEDDPKNTCTISIQEVFGKHRSAGPFRRSTTIEGLRRKKVLSYRSRFYRTSQIVIAVAGNFRGVLCSSRSRLPSAPRDVQSFLPRVGFHQGSAEASTYGPSLWNRRISVLASKEYPNRTRTVAGLPSECDLGRRRQLAPVQEVREKRGLAYSIIPPWDALWIAVCHRLCRHAAEAAPKVLAVVLAELRRLKTARVGRAELERAKSQLKGNLMLSLETSGSRMCKAAKDELYFGRHISCEEIMADIDRVSPEQLWRLSDNLFDDRYLTVTALGPIKKGSLEPILA